MKRRDLLSSMGKLSTGLVVLPHLASAASGGTSSLQVAVVGLKRGMDHVKAILHVPGVAIRYHAETDDTRLAGAMKAVAAAQKDPCKGVTDFRTFLHDKDLDAVFIATPNFWHTPAALLCMAAGKHVYV